MATEDSVDAEHLRIVFFQQDPSLAETYRTQLELDGYHVVVASPSGQSLQELRSQPPDIIFLDASLSAPADGNILRDLRQDPTTGRIPVVILSDRTAGELALAGMNLGPLDYLVPCM